MTRDEVVGVLLGMDLPNTLLKHLPDLPDEVEGLLVYGSQARGDAVPD